MTIVEFGEGVRAALSSFPGPAIVEFRGSFANGMVDEFSDVDLWVRVSVPLDEDFFASLESVLQGLYGPALFRYDPDYRETATTQGVRVSFYGLPVFWRLDLIVESECDPGRKYPDPFPHWSVGTSTLMNLIWALKYSRRGRTDDADRYIEAACKKIGVKPVEYTAPNALVVLGELQRRDDVDGGLLSKTHDAIVYDTGKSVAVALPSDDTKQI